MSISAPTRTAGPFAGTGVVLSMPFTFKVFQASDLVVTYTAADLTQSTWTLSTDYTVSLNTDQDTLPGGTVTSIAAVASGASVMVGSNIPATQPASLQNLGGFFPKVIEGALDRLTILIQQLISGVASFKQSLRVPEVAGVVPLPAATSRANRLLGFDSTGQPLMLVGAEAGSATQLQLDLANGTDAAKGSAMVAYNATTTVRQQFAAIDAGLVIANEANFPGITSSDPAIATPAMQLFLNACRGKRGILLPITYTLNAALTYDPKYPTRISGATYNKTGPEGRRGTTLYWPTVVCDGLQIMYSWANYAPGGGADAHTRDANIASPGSGLGSSDNSVIFEDFAMIGPGATNAPLTQSLQLFEPGLQTVAKGSGIRMYWAVDTIIRNLWVSDFASDGLVATECFSSRIERGYFTANRGAGINLQNQTNAFVLDNVKCIANGRISGPFANFNCFVGGSRTNLGVQITNQSDFESCGYVANPGYGFTQAAGTLTALTVTSGVATATFTGTVNYAVGDWIGVAGGRDALGAMAGGTQTINTVGQPNVILSKTATQITWATTAPDGNYIVATGAIVIGPYSVGLGIQNSNGVFVNCYSEGTTGPGIYVYGSSRAVTMQGCSIADNRIYIEATYYAINNAGSVATGGSGYTTGQVLTVQGGTLMTGQTATTVTITATAGAITAFTVTNEGRYTTPPTSPVSLSVGTGTLNMLYAPIQANGVNLISNAFYASGAGIYAENELGITLSGNQYFVTSAGTPKLYLGSVLAAAAPKFVENGTPVSQGATTSRGINQYISAFQPGDITNWFSGLGAGLNLSDQGTGTGTARQNTGFGALVLANNTVGYNNTTMGYRAGNGLITGFANTIVGAQAAESGANLQNCVAIGFGAGRNVTSGGSEVNIGAAAGLHDTASASNGSNVNVGATAGRITNGAVTGTSTIIGAQSAGFAPTSGMSNYMGLGYNTQADATYPPVSNRTVIGNSATTQTIVYGAVVTVPLTVATLPTASATLKGARSFVTDANATMTAGIGAAVASGGANNVPVYCDGTTWRIG